MYQRQFWNEMYQLKFHTSYINVYIDKTEFIDKSLSIFLAITSSSSICGWVIWQQYNFVWAIIIAISQLVTAIKIFLPYKNRLKTLRPILNEFTDLCIDCEKEWFDVSEGNMTSKEVHNLRMKIKSKKSGILKKYLGKTSLPQNKRYSKIATKLTKENVQYMYGQGDDNA